MYILYIIFTIVIVSPMEIILTKCRVNALGSQRNRGKHLRRLWKK
jgi:hypothetical protein